MCEGRRRVERTTIKLSLAGVTECTKFVMSRSTNLLMASRDLSMQCVGLQCISFRTIQVEPRPIQVELSIYHREHHTALTQCSAAQAGIYRLLLRSRTLIFHSPRGTEWQNAHTQRTSFVFFNSSTVTLSCACVAPLFCVLGARLSVAGALFARAICHGMSGGRWILRISQWSNSDSQGVQTSPAYHAR